MINYGNASQCWFGESWKTAVYAIDLKNLVVNAQLALCDFHFLVEKFKEVDTDYQNYLSGLHKYGDKSAKIETVYKTAQNGVGACC